MQFDTSTVSGKRALRDYNEAQNAYMTRVLASDKEISSISEDMTAAHVVLDEAILALRNATTKKLNAFVSGVRSSYSADLENYRLGVDFSFSNSAKDSYFERHRETDTAIYARIK